MASERIDISYNEPPKIWMRPSQIKIKYPPNHHDPLDPSHRIIEVLRTSHMRSPARISAETIINLSENGVPSFIFEDLLKAQVREIKESLTTWEGPDAMYKLWSTVERSGAVLFSRRAREAAGEARVRGFGDRSADEGDDDDKDIDEDGVEFDSVLEQRSTAWWADQTSGCPSSLEETVMVLLDSGFTPQDCPVLREKLKKVVISKIKTSTMNYRYEVLHSALAFVVPGRLSQNLHISTISPCNAIDHLGVLGENEIQVKSSRRNLMNSDGQLTDIILGDVLVRSS